MAKSGCASQMPVRADCTHSPSRVQRQSSSHVGTVRKCLPAAPPAVPKDWQPGTGTDTVQGDSQVSQMHVFAVAHHGFGSSTYSARGLCSGMRLRLAAEGPAGRTCYLLRDVYFYHCFLLSKQANVTQSFLSSLPTFKVGCLAKTTSQECCKNRPLLPTIPCDPLSLQCPLVSGSKVTGGFCCSFVTAASWTQHPGLSSCGEKRQAACRGPVAVTVKVRMKIHCLPSTCWESCTWPHKFGLTAAAVGVNPVATD